MGAGMVSRAIPARLENLRRRFERWRQKRKHARARIPEPLWDSAVTLAHAYGIHRTSKTLRLDYYCLKKRVAKDPATQGQTPASAGTSQMGPPTGATFLELPAAAWPMGGECTVELEDVGGAKMRVHWKGFAVPDLGALSRSFWESAS